MKTNYKIEIELCPTETINKDEPYFWSLMSTIGDRWHTSTVGYAATPEKAFEKACGIYEKYKMNGEYEQ